MKEKAIIITNNKLSYDYYKDRFETIFIDGSLMDVLISVRDFLHKGHTLLTHPLMGSIKPNQTPFKTVAISHHNAKCVDFYSIQVMENSIETAVKLIKDKPCKEWTESVIDDFSVIDFDLIQGAFN